MTYSNTFFPGYPGARTSDRRPGDVGLRQAAQQFFAGLNMPRERVQTSTATLYKYALPGVNPADLDIEVKDGVVNISVGEGNPDAEAPLDHSLTTWHAGFKAALPLDKGADAEKISAELKNGVLVLTVPFLPERQPRNVKVNVNGAGTKKSAS